MIAAAAVAPRGAPVPAMDSRSAFASPPALSDASATEVELRQLLESLRQSEARYQLLAHASPVGIFHTNAAGACTYANPRCCELTGCPIETITGGGWSTRLHPDDRDAMLQRRQVARDSERPFEAEYRFVHENGRVVWVYGQSQPTRDATGRILAWIGTLTDITQSKVAQVALRQSERRYMALAEHSPVGIWQIRQSGETLYLNPAMRALLELEPGDALVDRRYHDFFTPPSLKAMEVAHARRADGMSCSYEVELIGDRGTHRAMLICGGPVMAPDGSVESLIGTFVDVTERHRIEQTLRDTYASLREAHSSLRESEDRLRLLVNQTPAVLWSVDRSMTFTSSEGGGLTSLGLRPQQVVGMSLEQFFSTSDPAFVPLAGHRRALDGLTATYEMIWEGRLFHTTVEPLRGPDGLVVGAIGISVDITARMQAEEALRAANDRLEARVRDRTAELERANGDLEQQVAERLRAEAALREVNISLKASEAHHREAASSNGRLLMELDHRVRNNVAGLLSLVSLMRSHTRDVDDFATAIESRLNAMAQVHDTLARTRFQPVDLDRLVRDLLKAVGTMSPCPGETRLSGPPTMISPRQTLPLSMILLEWFTNSCKYGAYSVHGGRIDLRWEIMLNGAAHAGKRVRLRWTESGGPPVTAEVVPSLGTELVESFASLELRGTCALGYPPSGVDHALEFPLD